MNEQREMPKYECHKIVWALKIIDITHDAEVAKQEGRETDGGAFLSVAEQGYEAVKVNREYMGKHSPVVGGYYVVYQDGYKSFSPATAFEAGYTLITTGE